MSDLDKNKEIMKGFWSRLWELLKPSHKQIKGLFILMCFFELSRLIAPYFLKLVIDEVTSNKIENLDKITILILMMFFANQLVAFIDYFLDKMIIKTVGEVEAYLPIEANKKLLSLSLNYHEKENTGSKISKVSRGVDKVVNFLGNFFWDVAPTGFQIILTTIVLFFVDWRFGFVFLFFVPIFIYLTLKANASVYPQRKKRHEDYDESSGLMAQAIININTVKSFVQEKREDERFSVIRNNIFKNLMEEFRIMLKFNWGRSLIIDLGRTSMLLFGVYLVWTGSITVGSLVFIFTISEKALLSLFRISRLYDRIMESSEAIDRLHKLSEEKHDVVNPKKGHKPKTIIGQIEFKNVDFAYDDSNRKALDNVSLKINSGCFTALVGPSGGGKTTVVRMVYRHYDPQKGQILLDDKDLTKYDIEGFRKFIAIVPQEVEIFNASIKDNIAYANPKAEMNEIKAAARIANAEEFIKDLKEGYETMVGERGIKLSGGQRQRIGIARAILANPRILIFDEATSSLDSQSERLIQDAMDKISKGRTIIVIAHRLSTIKKAHKIIVLENGQVVEEGSHYELAQTKSGLYAKLLSLQEMGDVE